MDKAVFVTRFDSQDHLWQTMDAAEPYAVNLALCGVARLGDAGGECNETGANLGDIEAGEIFFKDVPFDQQVQKVSSTHILEHLSI